MSSSTTSGVPPARSAWCCWLACWRFSQSSPAPFPSIAFWVSNDAVGAHRLGCERGSGPRLPDVAAADYRPDFLLRRPLSQLPATFVLAQVVSRVFRQSRLDAGDAR